MFKIFALLFIVLGIYIGMNYSDEVQNIMDTELFKQLQETVITGKDFLIGKLKETIQ
ncbi:hypothetical protein ACU5DF_03710 [Aliivibrio wodanis]|uniref:Uncharacterized protein n=1 Tax=Aliivibrio wodanis TaxID=80852 RepID=A0A5Q4ZXV6_9GAMM|nr:hypothetical protein AW0309160_03953 [Aliivibrio wodanis]